MRARDALGRPVASDSLSAVEPVPEEALPPVKALTRARALLAGGRAFAAHEVLEAVWKGAPAGERDLWRGLAQLCVGLTHLQRGNPVGAARLLRRGAGLLRGADPAYGVRPQALAAQAERVAEQVEAGGEPAAVLDL